tara:strand:- start:129 stop:278 length:150 start_codon:yes stop_codon:yes gene_type:complete
MDHAAFLALTVLVMTATAAKAGLVMDGATMEHTDFISIVISLSVTAETA